jgi:hypothetical protein
VWVAAPEDIERSMLRIAGVLPVVGTMLARIGFDELLAAYKRQPRLERRHATFKGV